MKAVFRSVIRYFVFFSLAFLLFMLSKILFHNIYSLFSLYYPDTVPRYDEISTPEKYERLSECIAVISALFSIAIASFLSTVCDNERYEYMISETDGFYRLGFGTRLYIKKYFLPDAIASLIAPLPLFFLGFINLPERPRGIIKYLVRFFENFISHMSALTDTLGSLWGLFAAILTAILAKLLFAPYAARRYRARWLASF